MYFFCGRCRFSLSHLSVCVTLSFLFFCFLSQLIFECAACFGGAKRVSICCKIYSFSTYWDNGNACFGFKIIYFLAL